MWTVKMNHQTDKEAPYLQPLDESDKFNNSTFYAGSVVPCDTVLRLEHTYTEKELYGHNEPSHLIPKLYDVGVHLECSCINVYICNYLNICFRCLCVLTQGC